MKLVHGGVLHALEGLTAMHKLLQRFEARRLVQPSPVQCRAAHSKLSCTVHPVKHNVCQGIVMLNGFRGSVHITITPTPLAQLDQHWCSLS